MAATCYIRYLIELKDVSSKVADSGEIEYGSALVEYEMSTVKKREERTRPGACQDLPH